MTDNNTVPLSAPRRLSYTGLTLRDAMLLVPARDFTPWGIDAPPLEPGVYLTEALRRFASFDLEGSESAKLLLIDAVLVEIVPRYALLKVWKTEPLETDTLTGFADYLIAPKRAYLEAPLLCAVEAKKDDFEAGEIQCVAEMVACRWINAKRDVIIPIYGIVTNGGGWQFYSLTPESTVLKSSVFGTSNIPELLGAVDFVCAACAANTEQ